MARRIVRQPDGLLSVWSTIVDNFIITDATEEQLLEELLEEAVQKERERIKRDIENARTDYDYHLRLMKEVHEAEEEEV